MYSMKGSPLPQMLLNLHKKTWMTGLQLNDFKEHSTTNEQTIKVCYHWLPWLHATVTETCMAQVMQLSLFLLIRICLSWHLRITK